MQLSTCICVCLCACVFVCLCACVSAHRKLNIWTYLDAVGTLCPDVSLFKDIRNIVCKNIACIWALVSLLGGWGGLAHWYLVWHLIKWSLPRPGQRAWSMVREKNGSVVNSWHNICCTIPHDTTPYHTVCMDSVMSLRNGHKQLSKIACLEMYGAWLLTCVISFFTWVSSLFSCVFLLRSSLTSSSILVIFLSKSYLMLKHFETILEESVQLLAQVIAKLIMRIRYY